MALVSIKQLGKALTGKRFGELVSYLRDSKTFEQLESAYLEAVENMQCHVKVEIDDIINRTNSVSASQEFWNSDCQIVLKFITGMTQKHLSDRKIQSSEKELIEIFHIIAMNYAYLTYQKPRMKSLVQHSVNPFCPQRTSQAEKSINA